VKDCVGVEDDYRVEWQVLDCVGRKQPSRLQQRSWQLRCRRQGGGSFALVGSHSSPGREAAQAVDCLQKGLHMLQTNLKPGELPIATLHDVSTNFLCLRIR